MHKILAPAARRSGIAIPEALARANALQRRVLHARATPPQIGMYSFFFFFLGGGSEERSGFYKGRMVMAIELDKLSQGERHCVCFLFFFPFLMEAPFQCYSVSTFP